MGVLRQQVMLTRIAPGHTHPQQRTRRGDLTYAERAMSRRKEIHQRERDVQRRSTEDTRRDLYKGKDYTYYSTAYAPGLTKLLF